MRRRVAVQFGEGLGHKRRVLAQCIAHRSLEVEAVRECGRDAEDVRVVVDGCHSEMARRREQHIVKGVVA